MLALQSMFWTANNSSFFYVESCVLSPFWTTSYVIWASKSGAVVCSDPSGPFLGFRKRTQFLPIHTHSERHTDTLLSLLYTERSILPPVVIAYYPLLHYPFFFFFFFFLALDQACQILADLLLSSGNCLVLRSKRKSQISTSGTSTGGNDEATGIICRYNTR